MEISNLEELTVKARQLRDDAIQIVIVNLIPPLLQAAINQNPLPVDLQAVAAAGDALVRSVKTQLHGMALLTLW